MAEVTIPFLDRFEKPLLSGQKVCTSRSKRYGQMGDTFRAFNAVFKIIGHVPTKVGKVADHLWYEEGCESREDFIAIWKRIHPRKGFDPDQDTILHIFLRL